MARDYTKYSIKGLGENLNKRQLVFTILKDYIEKNNPSLEVLLANFPDSLQGSQGVVRKESDVYDPKRFNIKAPLKIKNGMHVVVSNQWGDNLPGFIQHAENLGYEINSINNENDNNDLSNKDFIKLNRFELEIPFPSGVEIIEISVANSNEKMWQDLGERIIVHYDVVNNAIVKHNNYEDEPIFEYLDVWEAEIPETYVDLTEWLGDIFFSGQINGNDWNISYHGGYIDDRLNISEEIEKIVLQNFNEKKMYHFIDEILDLF
ncbi:MAG: hypothetical protein KA210_07325 [Bacteroidia bacterium]|nr:hypothetical protein [Bacteroidia bacterium]